MIETQAPVFTASQCLFPSRPTCRLRSGPTMSQSRTAIRFVKQPRRWRLLYELNCTLFRCLGDAVTPTFCQQLSLPVSVPMILTSPHITAGGNPWRRRASTSIGNQPQCNRPPAPDLPSFSISRLLQGQNSIVNFVPAIPLAASSLRSEGWIRNLPSAEPSTLLGYRQ